MTTGSGPTDSPEGLPLSFGNDVFASAFAGSPTPMCITDPRQPGNPIVWMNAAFVTHTGYGRDELIGRNCRMLQGGLSDPAEVARIGSAIAEGRAIETELFNYRKDGTAFWNAMTIAPVRGPDGSVRYFYAAQADMTEKLRLEAAMRGTNDELERQVGARTADLQSALEQMTALLHEVDHRVKNNLQVISSLMLLKARRTPEGPAREALQGMAERIGALSTAHRMLYSAGDATRFNLKEFAADLTADLAAGLDPKRTALTTSVDPIAVSAAMAAPLALVIHELATNAVRHAFPGERPGAVIITARHEAGALHLSIVDDGVGLSAGLPNPAGFGRNLVEMVVRQLRGTIDWTETEPGTRVQITVPLDVAEAA